MKRAKFALGQIVATPGAIELMKVSNIDGLALLQRHVTGDWGVTIHVPALRVGAR
jgi:hypothetical protein